MTVELTEEEANLIGILIGKEQLELTELIQKYRNISFDSKSDYSARLHNRNLIHLTYLKGQLSIIDDLMSKFG